MKLLKALLVLVFIISFSSCNKDDSPTNPQDQDPNLTVFAQNNFGNAISRHFLGSVIDTNNNPINNVLITIGNQTAMTDNNGVFIIQDASVRERFGYVTAEKAGFIHASRAVVPSEGTNKIRIMMLAETIAGSTSSGTQETITLANGASVSLEGDYIKDDGTSYSGNVNVIMHHLDPTNENMNDQMPGMLYAANAQNEERMLQTFGMLAVELRGDNGEDLNIAEGSTAEIIVPLDASILNDAPSTIPLWYFDEVNGYWIEDGQATLVGNTYVGTVSHFSFWNCDIPVEAVNLCITIKDENGVLLSGLNATISSTQYGSSGGITNENGIVCGLVPSNESLELNIHVLEDLCTNSLYSGTIGPFSSDSNIEITNINNDASAWLSETIIGNFTDCNGNLVTEGYARLYNEYNDKLDIDFIENGEFELSTVRCNTNIFKIRAVDYTNSQVTGIISFTYTHPTTNIGTIASCNSVDEFITYSVDGGASHSEFIDIQAGINPSYLYIQYNNNNGSTTNNSFSIGISNQGGEPITIGSYPTSDSTFLYFQDEVNAFVGENTSITINISAIGNVGDYIDLNFIGTYHDTDLIEHSITGTLHVLRDY